MWDWILFCEEASLLSPLLLSLVLSLMASSTSNTRGYPPGGYTAVSLNHPGNVGSYENSPSSAYPPPFSRASADRDDNPRGDSFSVHSHAPLAPKANTEPMPTMPGMPVPQNFSQSSGATRPPVSHSSTGLTHRAQSSSWDLLAGLRKEAEGFDTRNASESHLQFAQGDMPNTKVRCIFAECLRFFIDGIV